MGEIYRSKRMLAENPGPPRPEQLPTAGAITEFHESTRYVRVLAYPIQARNRKYAVQTGIALNKSTALLNAFGTDLHLLTPAVILLAALGGHWMSRKALQPVALLAAQTRRAASTIGISIYDCRCPRRTMKSATRRGR